MRNFRMGFLCVLSYAVATEYIAQGEWGDPEVLERLKAKATKFRLDEGETKTLELEMQ
jgi:hypothetical protein